MLHVWYIYLQNWVILFGQMLINSSTTVRIWGRKPWFGIGFDPCLADGLSAAGGFEALSAMAFSGTDVRGAVGKSFKPWICLKIATRYTMVHPSNHY